MTRPGGIVHSLADFHIPRPGGGAWQVGVLGNSAADTYAQRFDARLVNVVRFDGATNAIYSLARRLLSSPMRLASNTASLREWTANLPYRFLMWL